MTIDRRRDRITSAILLSAALSAAACVAPATSPSPTPSGPLVSVEARGGECVAGPCATTVVIDRDGRVHQAAKPPNDLGSVPPATLASLVAAIDATDFAALESHPFTGQCPTAFDGQEFVFEFGAPSGVERVATCEVQVDFAAPLFVAVSTALSPYLPLPTP